MLLPHLASRIFNVPLLIAPAKLDAILAGLGPRFGLPDSPPPLQLFTTDFGERKRPGYRAVGGIGVIDIFGILAHRGRIEADSSYVMGYQEIARMLSAAMADNDVAGVLLNIDSPGGEAAGAIDMADQLRAAGATKPIWASISDLGLSGGYLMAMGAERIGITRTGMAGSIGVVMRHLDASALMAKEGVRITHIFAGAHKVDGNPYEPLPEAVRAEFQRQINGVYHLFVSSVAQSRGISEQAVRDTEAGIFTGQEAVTRGLADLVATPDQMLAEMRDMIGKKRKASKGAKMENDDVVITQAQVDSARHHGFADGFEDGKVEGAKMERQRIQDVEAQVLPGHEKLIAGLKYDGTTTGAEAAVKVLQAERDLRGKALSTFRTEAPNVVPLAPPADTDARLAAIEALPLEERCKAQWEMDSSIRGEFTNLETYVAFTRAEESGKVRILGKK